MQFIIDIIMNNQTVNNRIWLFVVGKTDAIFHFLKTNPHKFLFNDDL